MPPAEAGLVVTRQGLAARLRSARRSFRGVVQFIPSATLTDAEWAAFSRLKRGDASAADLRTVESAAAREMNPHRKASSASS